MPQRKTHDVYAGNQKVGEIWESYSGKTSYEAEMGVKIGAIDLIRAEGTIRTDEKLRKRYEKMKRNYKIRKIIGCLLRAFSVISAFAFVPMARADKISFEAGVIIVGALGAAAVSLLFSAPYNDKKKIKTVIPWGSVFGGLIVGFIGTVLLHLSIYRFI